MLLGRPIGVCNSDEAQKFGAYKEQVKQMLLWGVSLCQIAKNINADRNTVSRLIGRWGYDKLEGLPKQYNCTWFKNENKKRHEERKQSYKDTPYKIVELDRKNVISMIESGMTIPQIAEVLTQYTYEQIYDTILCDAQYNNLYRANGQLKLVKRR